MITTDQILTNEFRNFYEALGDEIEMTDSFIEAYCGKTIYKILKPMTVEQRNEFVIDNKEISGSGYTTPNTGYKIASGFFELPDDCILVSCPELEVELDDNNPIKDMDNVTVNDSNPGHGYIYIGTGFFYNIVVGHYI